VRVELLHPDRAELAVDDLLTGLGLARLASDDRPHLVLNMVASIDGRTTIDGRVGALTSPIDQRIVYRLRTEAEALMVGAGTVRNERYGSIVPAGLGPRPLVVIVTRRVALPADLPLLNEPENHVVIATTSPDAVLGFDTAAHVEYLRVPAADGGAVDVAALCAALRSEYGVRSVVCEGGPTLNDALLQAGVVDELFLSLAPLLVGGGERALVDDSPPLGPRRARVVWVATAGDYLFLRYAV
jgi:riboflavin-specific deaminase-like protein